MSTAATLNDLFPADYDALRRVAARYLRRERPGHTLEAAALVNEAYLQLASGSQSWNSRAHMLGAASQRMRRILVDCARLRMTAKRGGGAAV